MPTFEEKLTQDLWESEHELAPVIRFLWKKVLQAQQQGGFSWQDIGISLLTLVLCINEADSKEVE